MKSCITGSIVDVNISIISCDRTVCEYYIRYIANSLFSKRSDQESTRFSNDLGRIFKTCGKCIYHITKSCSSITYTVCNMDPSLRSLDWNCTSTILGFCDRMILSLTCNDLFINYRMCNIIAKSKSDSSAASCINEVIHRSCIESIFTIYKFWMEYNITLLRRIQSLKIIQSLPLL